MPTKSAFSLVVRWILLPMAIGACSFFTNELPSVEQGDLVGTWQANYADSHADVDPSGVETLILRDDGTYQQTYADANGRQFEGGWNRWYLDSDKLIHLEGGRWFPLGVEDAEQAAKGDVLSMKLRGKDVTVDLSKEILLVVTYSGGELALQHLPIAELDVPGIVEFKRMPVTTPSP